MGGSSSNSTPRAAVEAPNTLLSNTRIKILDLIGEGTQAGLWVQSGVSGSNPLCSMYMNDTPILNGDGSPNFNISGQGFSWGYRSGVSGQSYLPGFEKVEAMIPLPVNTRVTFPPENNGFPKPVVVSFNTTMYPDAEAVKVTMRIPQLFTVDKTNGDTNQYNIGWLVECQLNGGEWQTLDTQSLVGKCTQPFLKTLIYPLPKTDPASDFYEWKVRVRRTTQMVLSSSTANDLYVDSISVVSSNTYSYPMSALVGLSLSADQFDSIPTRAYDVKGIKVLVPDGYTPTKYGETSFTRQCDYDTGNKLIGFTTQSAAQTAGVVPGAYVSGPGIPAGSIVVSVDNDGPSYFFAIDKDPTSTLVNQTLTFTSITPGTITQAVYPTVWTGQFSQNRQWTDNPAWIFYDLCTNKRYGLGNYVRPEWIDKWTLYQIAQFCDELVDDGNGGFEPRFTCNVAIQEAQDAYTLLNNLVSVFRGMLYWSNGRIYPVGSETRDSVFNFTNANVVGGAFTYSDTPRNTRSTVCLIKWIDPDNLFRPSVERVEDPDGIARYGVITKEVTSFATTSRGQAVRAANWILTVERLLTETISFSTDMEGLYLRPGDVFNVYDNYRNNQQQGGRIVSFSSNRSVVELDKEVNLQAGFVYQLSAMVPATTIGTGITGSDQIGALRNSQIETRQVITSPANGLTTVTVNSGFSAGLFRGSVWILNATGSLASVFDQATQYKVLATSEPRDGITEVVGVEYNTGVNYIVNRNYSVVVSPPVAGDTTPPAPPTGLSAQRVTGLLVDNSFFSYVYLSWTGSTSANAAYHILSGKRDANPPFAIGSPPASQTDINYTPDAAGTYEFSVGAANANGYESAFNRVTYVEPATNPLPTSPLSGIIIEEDFDPYYRAASPLNRYTGYVGNSPTFSWNIQQDVGTDLEVPSAQFITGYKVSLLDLNNESTVLNSYPIIVEGKANTVWTPDERFLTTGVTVTPLRGFTISVETLDSYGNVTSGARLRVNNPHPRPPVNSGFVGFEGGVYYNITPAREADLSGVYLWTNLTPSYTPHYGNIRYNSTNLSAFAPVPAVNADGSFYVWYSLLDTRGFSGSISSNGSYNAPIYGPISGNATAIFGELDINIDQEINDALGVISGAFNYLTGDFTQSLLLISGSGVATRVMVDGISGQIIGANGAINTALTVRVDTAVVSSSGSLAQQINAVSARLETTGSSLNATVGQVSTALTQSGIALGQQINVVQSNLNTTNSNVTATGATLLSAMSTSDGALAQWITNLGVQTTGASASVRIGAEAFVTGGSNGIGGVAVARWGFELDANGKVVSMKATSNNLLGQPSSFGTIVFGNANLQSNTYSAGSAGWQISADGNIDASSASIRGAFTGGSAASNYITADSRGFASRTNGTNDRVEIANAATNAKTLALYNSSNNATLTLANINVLGNIIGELSVRNQAGTANATINGLGGAYFGGGGGTVEIDSTTQHDGQVNITSSNKLHFSAAGTNVAYIAEDYGMNLWGDDTHPIKIRGGSLVRGSSAGTNYGGGGIFGFNIEFDPDSSLGSNTFEAGTHAGADTPFYAYLKMKGPGGVTIYVPYTTTAP